MKSQKAIGLAAQFVTLSNSKTYIYEKDALFTGKFFDVRNSISPDRHNAGTNKEIGKNRQAGTHQ
ncbi:hypothetical protein [Flavobacterium sp. 3HN19-14]|uniref:hypothetical protein n=1 Tax=Flavobacterium sp. 3HN19-14 TaxID=3448133 RepID=UPI003EDF1357